MIDWKKDLKDSMWSMFWVGQAHGAKGSEADKEALKENVARLIRMTTQKTAGQRHVRDHLDWNQLETVTMGIICSATRLCLDGEFGEMPDAIEPDPE